MYDALVYICVQVAQPDKMQPMDRPVWARVRCRISPPHFLAECRKRRLNPGSFVSAVCLIVCFVLCYMCIFVIYIQFFSLLFVSQ